MATPVIMPKLGLTMTEGTIVEWKKKEGERVEEKEILYVLQTEKLTFEVEATESGILGKIFAVEGEVVPVGGLVGYILQPGEKLPDVPEVAAAPVKADEGKAREQVAKLSAVKAEISKRIKISPLARRIAGEHNIDLGGLTGSGPGGRIVREDVLRAVAQLTAAQAAVKLSATEEPVVGEKVVPLSSMRKTIARRMVESFQSAPHFYLTTEVDARELEEVRQKLASSVEERAGVRLTITDLLIRVVSRALEHCPDINCSIVDGSVKLFTRIDVGLVTAVEGGLVVPVVRQANKLSLPEISKIRAQLTEKAREHKISLDEMTGSTFTISNLGMSGIDQFSAIIQPPEAAILAVGRIMDKPVVLQGEIVVRPRMTLTLSVDHRILDGVSGARFLQKVKELIENPIRLLL